MKFIYLKMKINYRFQITSTIMTPSIIFFTFKNESEPGKKYSLRATPLITFSAAIVTTTYFYTHWNHYHFIMSLSFLDMIRSRGFDIIKINKNSFAINEMHLKEVTLRCFFPIIRSWKPFEMKNKGDKTYSRITYW